MNITKLVELSGNSSLRHGSDFIAPNLVFFWILFHFRVKTHYLPVRVESTHGWRKPLGSGPLWPSRKWWTGAGVTYKLPHRCGHWGCRGGERRRRAGGSEGGVPGFFFFTSKCMQLSSVSLAFLNRTGFACVHAYAQMCLWVSLGVSGQTCRVYFPGSVMRHPPSPPLKYGACRGRMVGAVCAKVDKMFQKKEKKWQNSFLVPLESECDGSNSFSAATSLKWSPLNPFIVNVLSFSPPFLSFISQMLF